MSEMRTTTTSDHRDHADHGSTGPATTHVVLVPGFWLGAWAWDDVVDRLREHGLDPLAVTLPGLEPDHPDRGSVTLDDHVRAVEHAMAQAPEGAPTVLVAHSGAAVPATVALDRHVDQVAHVVWVDTAPVVDGYAMDPQVEGAEHPLSAQWDDELEQGSMSGLSEEQLTTFRERAVPQPAATLREAVTLADDRRLDVPGTVVCTAFSADDYRTYAEQGAPFLAGILEHRALELVDLPTGHWPMWSEPGRLADLVADRATSAMSAAAGSDGSDGSGGSDDDERDV
jgi:pimeloyl-ACP methyl ester carboxylesterase